MKYRKIVVAIYIHPDFYPPTLNAINLLSSQCEELVVVTRNNCNVDYRPNINISYKKIGKFAYPSEMEKQSKFKKIYNFLRFTTTFFKNSISKKTDLIIAYDPIPLLSLYLFSWILKPSKKMWYHNHDIPEINSNSKFSIGWFAAKVEHKALLKMNFFSLPSNDRLNCYPQLPQSIKYFFLPNYPSLALYKKIKNNQGLNNDSIKILYQGSIGKGHSIEQLIKELNIKINNKNLKLVLKGNVREEYKKELIGLANNSDTLQNIEWLGLGLYTELQNITRSCDIGVAIHKGKDVMNKTLGTASNKIYEYIACGLPILIYDNEQFRKYLGAYKWAVFTDGTENSLIKSIQYIDDNFESLSKLARQDFENEFNFEKFFSKISLD